MPFQSPKPRNPTSNPSISPSPTQQPSKYPTNAPQKAPTASPSQSPSANNAIAQDDFEHAGIGVSFPQNSNAIFMDSTSNDKTHFGVALTTHSFAGDVIDFKVDFTSQNLMEYNTGYQPKLTIFYTREQVFADQLLQDDNNMGSFIDNIVAYSSAKIFNGLDYTWLDVGVSGEQSYSTSTGTQYFGLSLRLKKSNGSVSAYWRPLGSSNEWNMIGSMIALPTELQNVPLKFGFRVMKNYKSHHHFEVITSELVGNTPVPDFRPTISPVPSSAPSAVNAIAQDDFEHAGIGVSFPQNSNAIFMDSTSNDKTHFGVALTTHSFAGDVIDFKVDFTSQNLMEYNTGYQPKLTIFYTREQVFADQLLQDDNNMGSFIDNIVAYSSAKIFNGLDYTWLDVGVSGEQSYSTSTGTQYFGLSLRLKKSNGSVSAYWRPLGSSNEWNMIGSMIALPTELQNVPLKFGFRVMKNYKSHHHFEITTEQISNANKALILSKSDVSYAGRGISFPEPTKMITESSFSSKHEFGTVLTKQAYHGSNIDFKIDYTSTDFSSKQSKYQPLMYIFFTDANIQVNDLLQVDSNFSEFLDKTVAWSASKIFATMNHTWFYAGTNTDQTSGGDNVKHLNLSMRIRKYDNYIHAYFQVPGSNEWRQIGDAMTLPPSHQDIPLKFGFRVKKEWCPYHHYEIKMTKLAGNI